MSGEPDKDPEREGGVARRTEAWLNASFWLAAACLGGLAVAEISGAGTPLLRGLLMIGVAAAGTAVIVMQARRRCPSCGAPYGYHLRIVNANSCRRCGAEFPSWPFGGGSEGG